VISKESENRDVFFVGNSECYLIVRLVIMTTAIMKSEAKKLSHMDLSGLFCLLSALCIG
jgi:hypothetical protein